MTHSPIIIEIDSELKELIPDFLEKRKSEVPILRSSLLIGDYSKIKELSHKIKGNSGGYGFFEMGDIGARLELAATLQESQNTKTLIDELDDHIQKIQIIYI
jgi:HPt (histidine-containing phosphotransfer) domain-containing protein